MKHWILIGFLLTAQSAWAQKITGIILDKETNKPVADAHVQVMNTSFVSVTDSAGRFNFPFFKEQMNLRVTSVGYVPHEATTDKEGSLLTIILQPSVVHLNNEVIITAQRADKLDFEIPNSTTYLSKKDVAEKLSRSAPEALQNETGVWVQKTNHGGGSPIIRGLVGNQVLLLVDGIRMNNATYRYGPNQYLSTVDPGLIQQVEVLRGSGSVLYGTDALGGVVQVISKSPQFNNNGLSVSGNLTGKWMSAGMEKSTRAELQLAGAKVAFGGGISIRKFGDVLAGGNLGALSPTGYHENSGDAKVLIRTHSKSMLTAAVQYLTQTDVPRYDQVIHGGYEYYNFDPQQRQLNYVRWETFSSHPLLQSLRITTSLNRSVEGITSRKNNSDEIKTTKDEVNTFGFMVEANSLLSQAWHMQSGIEYYHDKVLSRAKVQHLINQTETIQRGSYADGSTNVNMAVYNNHQIDYKKLQFLGGIRVNNVTTAVNDAIFGDQRISPLAIVGNAGVLWHTATSFKIFGHINSGFRAPNIDDMSKFGTVESGVFEIPSTGLAPEKSVSVETGLKINKQKFAAAVAAFHTQLTNLIDRVPATYQGAAVFEGRSVFQKQNIGEAYLKGIEAETEITLGKAWHMAGNITYTYGKSITKNEPMRRVPPLFGRATLRYTAKSGVWCKLEWALADAQSRLAAGDKTDVRIASRLVNGQMPGWNILSMYSGFSYKSISVFVSAQNLFDKAYRVYGSGIDGYGRNMSVSVAVKI